jgi:hypothetical protein
MPAAGRSENSWQVSQVPGLILAGRRSALADVGDKVATLIHEALGHPRGPLAGASQAASAGSGLAPAGVMARGGRGK